MPNEDKNIFHERDILCEYFKDNLGDLQLPVDKRCWDNINLKLRARKRMILLKRTISGTAAAVLISIIICGISGVFSDKAQQTMAVATKDCCYGIHPHTLMAESFQAKRASVKISEQKEILTLGDCTEDIQSIDQNRSTGPTVFEESGESYSITNSSINNNTETLSPVKTDSLRNTFDKELAAYKNENEVYAHSRYGLSATFSTTGSTPGNRRDCYSLGGDSSYHSYSKTHDNKYSTPFSVGLMFSRVISKRYSLESGLVYNYLSTSYNISEKNSSFTLKLHYIGIPLNITSDLYQISPHSKIYVTAGVMVEKGIVSNLTQENQITGISITKSHKIDGVQLSINSAAGISCNIFDNWNIYFEPHVSYYFKNNQPLSIRTVKQTITSINTGLRYEF